MSVALACFLERRQESFCKTKVAYRRRSRLQPEMSQCESAAIRSVEHSVPELRTSTLWPLQTPRWRTELFSLKHCCPCSRISRLLKLPFDLARCGRAYAVESPDEEFADIARAPTRLLDLEADNKVLDLLRQSQAAHLRNNLSGRDVCSKPQRSGAFGVEAQDCHSRSNGAEHFLAPVFADARDFANLVLIP
jgi:hypothetical protein